MSVDEDFEELLRHRLHAEEPVVSTAPDLPERLIVTGSAQLRRRRRRAAGLTALVTVAAIAGTSVVTSRLLDSANPPPTSDNRPSQDRTPAQVSPGEWAERLPRGAGPDVAFLAGTVLHLRNGKVVDLEADADLIGETVAGVIVLVEDTNERGVLVGSRYVLVEDDGDVVEIPVSTLTAGNAQEALVSPDGRYFTNGGPVIDESTGAIVDEMPAAADVLVSWTPAGIIYWTREDQYYLWRIGAQPTALDAWQGGDFSNQTDVGLVRRGVCPRVVRLDRSGSVTEVGQSCLPKMFTVAPDGTRGISLDLEVVDTATGATTAMSERPLRQVLRYTHAYWEDADTVLVPIPGTEDETGILVRCHVARPTCERATDPLPADLAGMVDLP
jgi:hypothetical protein